MQNAGVYQYTSMEIKLNNDASLDHLGKIREFYQRVGYAADISEDDDIITARMDGDIIGAVRLCQENGVTVLRGMYVADDFQRAGVGTILLKKFLKLLAEKNIGEAYCIPYTHLETFYARIGFRQITPLAAPEFLRRRLLKYLNEERDCILMKLSLFKN